MSDPARPAQNVAIGIDVEGSLFGVDEQRISTYTTVAPVDRFVLDAAGRFLFVLAQGGLSVYRNPLVSHPGCKIQFEGSNGEPVVGRITKVTVQLRNTGSIPIHDCDAKLFLGDVIDLCDSEKLSLVRPAGPGETLDLDFRVTARKAGEVRLKMFVTLKDEFGPQDPIEIPFDVDIQEAAS